MQEPTLKCTLEWTEGLEMTLEWTEGLETRLWNGGGHDRMRLLNGNGHVRMRLWSGRGHVRAAAIFFTRLRTGMVLGAEDGGSEANLSADLTDVNAGSATLVLR